jgi:hypothetical protein
MSRKISALTATTTVGDTDQFAVVQSGTTKSITGAKLINEHRRAIGRFDLLLEQNGAVLDGVTDDGDAINESLEEFAGASGFYGLRAFLPQDPDVRILTNSQIVIPDRVRLIGPGARTMDIKAGASFPTSTALVLLGRSADSFAFNCGIEDLMLDCNGITGSICLSSTKLQEGGGCTRVNFNNYKDKGVSLTSNCANMVWFDCEWYAAASAASAIGLSVGSSGPGGSNFLHKATFATNDSNAQAIGADLGAAYWNIAGVHVERSTIGVQMGANASGLLHTIDGPTLATVTDLIKLNNKNTVCIAIAKGSATNVINDVAGAGIAWDYTFVNHYSSTDRTVSNPGLQIQQAAIYTGSGDPESVVTARIGSLYLRNDGSTSTTLYVKTSGSGNTGWTAK